MDTLKGKQIIVRITYIPSSFNGEGIFLCAGHGAQLGGERPLWGRSSQPPTTSQSQGCPS